MFRWLTSSRIGIKVVAANWVVPSPICTPIAIAIPVAATTLPSAYLFNNRFIASREYRSCLQSSTVHILHYITVPIPPWTLAHGQFAHRAQTNKQEQASGDSSATGEEYIPGFARGLTRAATTTVSASTSTPTSPPRRPPTKQARLGLAEMQRWHA